MQARHILFSALAAGALASGVLGQTAVQAPGETPAPTARDQAPKPPVPPGRDPGGVAIALIGTGIDYTLPDVASRLARDGEGELIGWDLQDQDRKPFAARQGHARPGPGDGTGIAELLLGAPGVRLVPVRVAPGDPVGLARALAFVAQTPARVAVLAMGSPSPAHWEPLRQAAQRFRQVLIVVPAGQGSEPTHAAALGLDNVLPVAPGSARAEPADIGAVAGHTAAAVAAASAAAELLAREPGLEAAALKRRLAEGGGGAFWQVQR